MTTSQQDKLNQLDAQWKDCMVQLADALLSKRDFGRKAVYLEKQIIAIRTEHEKIVKELSTQPAPPPAETPAPAVEAEVV